MECCWKVTDPLQATLCTALNHIGPLLASSLIDENTGFNLADSSLYLIKAIDLNPKICIVSSCGGHLTEVRTLRPAYSHYEHFYVINEKILLPDDMQNKTYFIRHSERDLLFLLNLWEAWRVLRKERPTIILSTGAGPLVPFAIIGKFLRIPTVFIESITRVNRPSLTGRIMNHLADRVLYQWPSLARSFPRGVCGGPIV